MVDMCQVCKKNSSKNPDVSFHRQVLTYHKIRDSFETVALHFILNQD